MHDVTILIPNLNGHEALALCIESILARTEYQGAWTIKVWNNRGDGQDALYLEHIAGCFPGKVSYVNHGGIKKPGEAATALFKLCATPWAVLLESDCEILRRDWLKAMFTQVNSERVIAVGRFFPPKSGHIWFMSPTIGPECLLMNMDLYRPLMQDNDWQQRSVPWDDYPYQDVFCDIETPTDWNGLVNLDTGWRFTERILFEKIGGYVINALPFRFFPSYVYHYGGISTRGQLPEIKPRWDMIRSHLKTLRTG